MSKRREAHANWFTLPYDERRELMHEHGTSGRKFAGRIVQYITGLGRPRRLRVGRHAVRRASRRPEGGRVHDALRSGVGGVRRVRAVLHRGRHADRGARPPDLTRRVSGVPPNGYPAAHDIQRELGRSVDPVDVAAATSTPTIAGQSQRRSKRSPRSRRTSDGTPIRTTPAAKRRSRRRLTRFASQRHRDGRIGRRTRRTC